MWHKYYILFERGLNERIKWPEKWGNRCPANVAPMLQEELKTGAVGGELKIILGHGHERDMMNTYDITYKQLYDYIKAPCGSLHFRSKGTRKRAIKALEAMGAKDLVLVDSYRDLLLFQAHYQNHGEFPVTNQTTTE